MDGVEHYCGEELAPILPDGWKEGDDIFAGETEEENGEAPTTGEQEQSAGSAGEPEGTPERSREREGETGSRILKLRVNHEDTEVDVNSMSDEAIIERFQKAEAFDAMKQERRAPFEQPGYRPQRDFHGEVRQFQKLYPDVQELPDEVARAVAGGTDLLTAYVAYREMQTRRDAQSLRKENQVLKQNADARARAPLCGVAGGGAAKSPAGALLEGFDCTEW
ncbi:MAG: hypothetical protein PUB51_00595 [Oscillospiraceae bacterium]|nr:hypothetical protein [Oscillospiraceae bacterium]